MITKQEVEMYESSYGKEKRYSDLLLFIARPIVYAGLAYMFIVGMATTWMNFTTAHLEYQNAHPFKPVHLNLK